MWHIIMKRVNLIDQLQHISNVLHERIALYRKRQLETKRATKAMHRGNLIPNSLIIHNMLDAHVNYYVNLNGINTINEILETSNSYISSYSDLESFFSSSVQLISLFSDKLINSKTLPIPNNYAHEITSLLFEAVFNYDENIQRQNISKYLKYSFKSLVQDIFKTIVILDDNFTSKIILALEIYYEKF